MADPIPARGTPESKVAAAEAPVSGSLNQPQDLNASISKANSPAEIRALHAQLAPGMKKAVDEARKNPDGAGKPATEIPPDLAAAEAAEKAAADAAAAAAAAGETTETPPEEGAEGEQPEGEEETAGAEEEGTEGGEDPINPITGKRAHLRLPPEDDKVGRLALSIMKRNQDLTLEEALERSRKQLGIKPKEEAAAKKDEAPANGFPTTIEETDLAIKALRADRKKANTEMNFEAASDASDKLEDLIQHRFNLERQTERKATEEAATYERAFTDSEAKAVKLYDFAGKPDSPGGKRMAEIDAELEANGDPLFHRPDKPLIIAQMVGAELKIAPRRPGTPVAPAKAAAPTNGTPPAKKQVLPGGGSRTTPPPVNQPPAIDAKIKSVKSIQDLRSLRKEMGLPI